MSLEEIREYFVKCRGYVEDNHMNIEDIPRAMREKNTWKVVESSLTVAEIEELENELQVEFPKCYKDYLMASSHLFENLLGKFDNFFFEDDVDIILKIEPQPHGEELKYVYEMLKENIVLVREKYLPLGVFDDNGYLCIDLMSNDEIVWLPYENCVGFTKREEFEEEQLHIFYEFDDFIKCFFGKETHEVED